MTKTDRTLFGTDGIRGKAGVYPVTAELALKLGQVAADVLLNDRYGHHWPQVIIGKDTRQSGDMFESAVAAGLNSRGVDVRLAGVVPTPAVAMLIEETDASFGVVISASHNPFEDNGIKFFGGDGYKLDDSIELALELALESPPPSVPQSGIGRTALLEDAAERYIRFVTESAGDPDLLNGMKIALDTANGAAFETSPAILEALGAEVLTFHNEPNGININADCGCTHAGRIESLVRETGASVGVSHDGDADRVLLCDENGSVLDGDEMMAIAAISMLSEGSLRNGTLVATQMSNMGLDRAVEAAGGKVLRTKVGDRYVVEAMRKHDYNLGGEQSGHFVFRDLNTTGDGIISAVQILSVVQQSGKPLSELRHLMNPFPQVQRNIRVSHKPDLADVPCVQEALAEVHRSLGARGRVLMRYSGTEPLLRILVEGENAHAIEGHIDRIAEAAMESIGVTN